ncbi:5-formyltetrahydrofolate cyclo-ligase, mitochondrial-like protein [Drosera capensis]
MQRRCCSRVDMGCDMGQRAKQLALMPFFLSSVSLSTPPLIPPFPLPPPNQRLPRLRPLAAMMGISTTTSTTASSTVVGDGSLGGPSGGGDPERIAKQKKILRSKVRRSLREMDPAQRLLEDSLAHDVKKLYVPRVEDRNCHMRMLNICSNEDLIANSMSILEPASVDSNGNLREDGLAFDKSGRRLGRGGGYYDTFLINYQNRAKERNWKQPLLVALSYSLQIMDDGVIPVTATDVPVDILVSPAGALMQEGSVLRRIVIHPLSCLVASFSAWITILAMHMLGRSIATWPSTTAQQRKGLPQSFALSAQILLFLFGTTANTFSSSVDGYFYGNFYKSLGFCFCLLPQKSTTIRTYQAKLHLKTCLNLWFSMMIFTHNLSCY